MRPYLLSLLLLCSLLSAAQQPRPEVLPESNIDIPIQLNLRPLFAMAERNVDTVFTSPNWPEGWVQADCATRFKYRFRRSPLRLRMTGLALDLGFTGFYQIIGSTRLCSGSTVLSPWTPGCKCGVDEPERRVEVGFASRFSLTPDYRLLTRIIRTEPVARDKCEVCFWGQDITKDVLAGLKTELDVSQKAMQDSFGQLNLRPYLQQVWTRLAEPVPLPGIGFFSLHPKRLRMQNIQGQNDLLSINIGITASPAVTVEKATGAALPLPNLSNTASPAGFSIYLDAALQYDSLSRLVTGYMAGKRFDVSDGLFKKHIVIDQVTVAGRADGRLLLKLDFSGSFKGTAFFNGNPVYNAAAKVIEVQDLDYDLETKNLLLKTAKWLFAGKIEQELKKNSSIPLEPWFQQAQQTLNTYLNKEWMKGVKGAGSVSELTVVKVQALPQHIAVKSACSGKLRITVSEVSLGL